MKKTKSRTSSFTVPRRSHSKDGIAVTPQESHFPSDHHVERELRASHLALEAKLQENARLKQEREALLQHLDVGVIVANSTGLITVVNESAARFLGKKRDQIVGLPLDQVWKASGLPNVPFTAVRYQNRCLTCEEHRIDLTGVREQEVIRFLKDVTMVATLQDQLASQQRLSVMGEMIGTIAHEIRNPLGSIELFASLLGTSIHDNTERQTLARHLTTVVRGLDQVLSNLLVMTRNLSANIQPVNLETLVHDVIMMAMHAIRERSVSVQENLDPSPRTVRVDEPLMKQALLNLLLNGIQASPENAVIEISSQWVVLDRPVIECSGERRGANGRDALLLRVRDYGCGISRADQDRIFEPFYSRRKGGTGIGLAIVRQIMDVHHGWVECTSKLGEGTTMTLWIPQGRHT